MTRKGGWGETGFGPALKTTRTNAGMSQRELAEKVGCTPNTLARIERSESEPAWGLVLTICKALGVSCEEFAQYATEEPPAEQPAKRGRPRKADTSEGEQPAKGSKGKGRTRRKKKGEG